MASNRLKPETIQILKNISIRDNVVYLNSGELERKLYSNVDEALKRLLGEWNATVRGHVFEYDPTDAIQEMIDSGILPEKNPLAFFPTPQEVIDVMFAQADIEVLGYRDKLRVLEPSAGKAAIALKAKEALPQAQIDTVELNEINLAILKNYGFDPFCGSFLDFNTTYEQKYDLILMNPPFSYTGDAYAYITHIEHAYKMLDKWGTLIAIAPTGFLYNSNKKLDTFRDWVYANSDGLEMIDKWAFKESGTMVETCVINLTKDNWRSQPHQGHANYFVWHLLLCTECNVGTHELLKKYGPRSEFQKVVDIAIKECENPAINTVFPRCYNELYKEAFKKLYKEDFEEEDVEEIEESIEIEIEQLREEVSLGGLFAVA